MTTQRRTRLMRLRGAVAALVLLIVVPREAAAAPTSLATLKAADLDRRFLLQVSYEQKGSRADFRTSRSRVVRFERDGAILRMLDVSPTRDSNPERVLATIPIRRDTCTTLTVDLNEGFHTVSLEEDRTGEDYYGRIGRRDDSRVRLLDRHALSVAYHGETLVFDQRARTGDGEPIVVHYYLSPYTPAPEFQPFEMTSLRRFGFYETYPQWRAGGWKLYAMKFDAHRPIVFALSSGIPAEHREAVRDGVLYWNRAFGRPLVRVIDAPPGVGVPSPDYNVIQWADAGDYASTSYIQGDPLTGQILRAHIFILPETMMDGDLQRQNDHLRYIVAHEIGHALGLRHNFAPGAPATVMDYFMVPQILEIGRRIRTGGAALPYDRLVMRHVYLGAPLDLALLPPFCTDSQRGCVPFRSTPTESEGIRGGAVAQ